jgi:carbon storage regulator
MLVLTRKSGETLLFQVEDVTVTLMITRVRGDNVRLGITAPPEVKVIRSELIDGKESSDT